MKSKKQNLKINDETKSLVLALTEKIQQQKRKQAGDCFEKDGILFKTKVKFIAKSMNKSQYIQLFALYEFMKENPNLSENEVIKALSSKPIYFAFLNKCVANIEDFLKVLKACGPVSMAEDIEIQNGGLEKWAKRHL